MIDYTQVQCDKKDTSAPIWAKAMIAEEKNEWIFMPTGPAPKPLCKQWEYLTLTILFEQVLEIITMVGQNSLGIIGTFWEHNWLELEHNWYKLEHKRIESPK